VLEFAFNEPVTCGSDTFTLRDADGTLAYLQRGQNAEGTREHGARVGRAV